MAALGAEGYTELVASTLEKIEPQLVDNIFTSHPTLDILKKYAKSYTGRSLVLNLEAAEDDNTVVTDSSGSFQLDVSPDIVGAAEYDWSAPYVSKVRVQWKTLQQNQGKEQLVNLAEAHLQNVQKSHARRIVADLHKPASQTQAGEFNSMDALVGNYDYNPEVGGITATDADHYWNATRLYIPVEGEEGGQSIRKAFRTVRNELLVNTHNEAQVDVIIAGRDVFEELEDSFDDKVRYVNFTDGQTRFRALFDGDIEVRLDPDMRPDGAYFLDSSSLRFGYLNGNFMKVQKPQVVTGTLDFITPLASVFAFGVNERRRNALLVRTGGAYAQYEEGGSGDLFPGDGGDGDGGGGGGSGVDGGDEG
jgi:hypothetical protein